jgi:lysophospholipase L1-like esterase
MKRLFSTIITVSVLSCSLLNPVVYAAENIYTPDYKIADRISINSNSAKPVANPVISRGVPAYSAKGDAKSGNDVHYFSFWNSATPDYLAYDLSGVPKEQKKQVIAVWYNTSAFDSIGNYANRNMEPSDYTIEVNSADGGKYPESGWIVAETVTDNTLSSRQHVVSMEGYNWIRINITKADGEEGRNASINFDIHNVSDGIFDSWLFLGDSITACGMNNCYGTGFATHVNELDSKYFPIQENGGIGGITSTDGKNNIDRWLETCNANFVSIAYGTNDAWGNPSGVEKYYENTKYMIDAVLEAGKIPVLPKIPYASEKAVLENLGKYNEVVEKLWQEYDGKIVIGPDLYEFLEKNPDYLSGDGVHPSDTGYAAIRKLWAETMYERVYTAKISEAVIGDINSDGVFDISDAVTLQKWLLSDDNAKINNWQTGDLCKDNLLDIADLSAMKNALIK